MEFYWDKFYIIDFCANYYIIAFNNFLVNLRNFFCGRGIEGCRNFALANSVALSRSIPERSIPKHGAFRLRGQELPRYAATVLVRPVRRSVRAIKPKSSVAASVVQFQLRCFIIWNLSRLSVDGLPVSEPTFSAI